MSSTLIEQQRIRIEQGVGASCPQIGDDLGQLLIQQGLTKAMQDDPIETGELPGDGCDLGEGDIAIGLAPQMRARTLIAELIAARGGLDIQLTR